MRPLTPASARPKSPHCTEHLPLGRARYSGALPPTQACVRSPVTSVSVSAVDSTPRVCSGLVAASAVIGQGHIHHLLLGRRRRIPHRFGPRRLCSDRLIRLTNHHSLSRRSGRWILTKRTVAVLSPQSP